MTRWLAVRMLPARTRARYGQELVALLDCSPRRLADTLDVLLLAAHAHLEDPMRRLLHTFANVSLAVSLVLLGYTVNDLSNGLTELPQHWWSSVAALSVIASGAAVLLTRHRPATSSSAIRWHLAAHATMGARADVIHPVVWRTLGRGCVCS